MAAEATAKQADLKEAVAGYKEEAESAAAEAKRLLQTLKCAIFHSCHEGNHACWQPVATAVGFMACQGRSVSG